MSYPRLEQAIGAWFAEIAQQGEYHRAMIVAFGELVVIATFNHEAIELVYEENLLTEVFLKPQYIDFADKAFGELKTKHIPKEYVWKLAAPTDAEKKAFSPRRIMMINPGEEVPTDRLPANQ